VNGTARHRDLLLDDNHIVTRWSFVTVTLRDAAAYTTADLGGVAEVGSAEPFTYYVLVGLSPLTWSALGGSDLTAANVGGGAGLFRDKTGSTLNLRSLLAGVGIAVSSAADTVSIAFSHVLAAALNAANFAVHTVRTVTYAAEVNNGTSGAAATINWTAGQKQRVTLGTNTTFAFIAPLGPCNVVFKIVQDGTGGRSPTWPTACRWEGGVSPSLTPTANATDLVVFYFDGTLYFGQSARNFM